MSPLYSFLLRQSFLLSISSHDAHRENPSFIHLSASLVAQRLKRLPGMWETRARSLDQEDHLKKEMATHSSTLVWRIPWRKEPGRLQSMGSSQRVGLDWGASLSLSAIHSVTSSEYPSVQFSSVTQACPTICDPMNSSTPGLPVHHQLPQFTQTHVHRVSDAIQPSHPLSFPSPPAPNPSQHQSLFQSVNTLHEVAKVLEFQL